MSNLRKKVAFHTMVFTLYFSETSTIACDFQQEGFDLGGY